jgi:sec-independent protein translocase protein TatC
MNRLWWWLIDKLSRSLEANERDTVLGDFAESAEPAGRALLDLLGLIVRRRATLPDGRLLRTLGAVLIGAGASFYFRNTIYAFLASPMTCTLRTLRLPVRLIYANPVDPFVLYLKLSIMTGVFLASPYLSWQFWSLFSPVRYRRRKGHVCFFVAFTSTLFVTGGFLAYKLAVPVALRYLVSSGSRFPLMVTINEYWNLAILVTLGVALLFELPGVGWLVYLKRAE